MRDQVRLRTGTENASNRVSLSQMTKFLNYRLWLVLLAGLIFSWTINPARAAGPHYVFAHYMVCYTSTYGQTVQGCELDIQEAQAAGIDGFALDLGAFDDSTQAYYNKDVAYMYEAAEALGTGFKLFFSLECTNTAAVVRLISTYASRPNTFLQGTNVVLSTYGLNNIDWSNAVFAPLQQQGISVYFVPYFLPTQGNNSLTYPTAVSIFNNYSNLVQGLFIYGGGILPNLMAQCNSNYTMAAHQAGKIYMASVTPTYWGCVQTTSGRIYSEMDGGEGIDLEWRSIIANQPDWVEIVTWNDFNESSYISPVNGPEQNISNLTTPHRYCHAGYLEFTKRYINWYKTGVLPATNQDEIFYFYRTHSTKLVASDPTDIAVTNLQGDVADVVYNTFLLTAPAQVQVASGTNSVAYSLGAGLQQIRTPFAPGIQSFTVNRNGKPVVSIQGPPILAAITNYDYFTASGYAYGLMPPTNLVAQP